MLKVVELKDAKKLISQRFSTYPFITVPLDASAGRILAKDVYSPENLPRFLRSAMDGYAVKASCLSGASQSVPVTFKLIGEAKMGQKTYISLTDDGVVYVPTGAMLPEGADAVVMIEHTSRLGDEIFVYSPVRWGENIIAKGEDYREGELLLSRGSILTSAKIGVLAAAGVTEVPVVRPMKFSFISTGDEIIDIGETVDGGRIRDINSHLLKAMIKTLGEEVNSVIIKDDFNGLVAAIRKALDASDVVVISGGSSVGVRDYTKRAILEFTDDLFIEGIALKPGKPTMAASVGEKLVLGLPGNPMAASVAFDKVFIEGAFDAFGVKPPLRIHARAKINFPSASGRATVMPLRLEATKDGYLATPLFYKSGLIRMLSEADGYTIIDENEEGIPKGKLLEVYPL